MPEEAGDAFTFPKKRIGLLVGKLAGGGAERVVSRLSYALSDRYDVTVLILRSERQDYPAAGKVIDLGTGMGSRSVHVRLIRAILRINKVIRRERLDVVISFLFWPNLINGLFNRSCPRAVSIRSFESVTKGKGLAARFRLACKREAYRRADRVIVLAERQKETLLREMNLSADHVSVLENFFDAEEIRTQSQKAPPSAVPDRFLTPMTSVSLGRLTKKKNLPRLLAVFAAVRKALPEARLLLVGDGPQREELEALCRRLGIRESVCFTGRLSNPFPVLASVGLYVSFSENEGFPNACVEAMILGLPVLHTDCPTGPAEILLGDTAPPGMPDDVCFGEYGGLIPVEGSGKAEERRREAAANAWIRLLTDRSLHDHYAESAILRSRRYGKEEGVSRYAALIEEITDLSEGKSR